MNGEVISISKFVDCPKGCSKHSPESNSVILKMDRVLSQNFNHSHFFYIGVISVCGSFWKIMFIATYLCLNLYTFQEMKQQISAAAISIKPLNAELNPICHLLALIGAHHILYVSRVRVNEHKRGWVPLVLNFLMWILNSSRKYTLGAVTSLSPFQNC